MRRYRAAQNQATTSIKLSSSPSPDSSSIQQESNRFNKNSKQNEEFSFNYPSNSHRTQTLRCDLQTLSKQEIIDLLVEEIQENRSLKFKLECQHINYTIDQHYRSPPQSIMRKHKSHHNRETKITISRDMQRQHEQKFCQSEGSEFLNCIQSESETYKQEYIELAQHMNEYINNTNQAQRHFFLVIKELQAQIQTLNSHQCHQQRQQLKSQKVIKNLEESIQEHIKINNEISYKCDKLIKQNQTLKSQLVMIAKEKDPFLDLSSVSSYSGKENSHSTKTHTRVPILFQNSNNKDLANKNYQISEGYPFKEIVLFNNAFSSNQSEINPPCVSVQFPMKHLQNRIKVLEIQNQQIKVRLDQTYELVEKKSTKIRQLVTELQKASEEKRNYKQQALQWKTKFSKNKREEGIQEAQSWS